MDERVKLPLNPRQFSNELRQRGWTSKQVRGHSRVRGGYPEIDKSGYDLFTEYGDKKKTVRYCTLGYAFTAGEQRRLSEEERDDIRTRLIADAREILNEYGYTASGDMVIFFELPA